MNKAQFWQLIEQTYDEEAEIHNENLKAALLKLSAPQIVRFSDLYDEFFVATYRWDLWAIAYIIGGGCSDDCFSDFCSMLVRRGREFYQAMLAQPEITALRYNLQEEDFDGMFSSCIHDAYEELTENPLPVSKLEWPTEPSGYNWNEEELSELYLHLWEKFG